MLSQSVREGLEAELDHLEAEKKQLTGFIDAKIAAIKEILRLDADIGTLQPTLPMGELPMKETDPASSGNGSLTGKGLRDAIRHVLATYPRGLRPIELAMKLESKGFVPGGKTPTKVLVYGETHRLYRLGKLGRRAGRYFLLLETQEGGRAH